MLLSKIYNLGDYYLYLQYKGNKFENNNLTVNFGSKRFSEVPKIKQN